MFVTQEDMYRRLAQQDDVTILKRKPAPQTAKPFAELVFVEKGGLGENAEQGFAAVLLCGSADIVYQ